MKKMILMKFLLALVAAAMTATAYAAAWSPTITVTPGSPACNAAGTGATVDVDFTVTSQAASAATLYYTLDGANIALPGIPDGNVLSGGGWTFVAKSKTYASDFTLNLANGDHTVVVCVVQPGAAHMSCDTKLITVNCQSTDPCANTAAFGEVPANKNLCVANGKIEVNFAGSFGSTASLSIYNGDPATGGTLVRAVEVPRSGDSCNYHYNWDPQADGAQAGTYEFDVGSLSFSATLSCDTHGNPK